MRANAGFSLVEVMCAILILGIGMVGFIQGVTTALGSSKESELQTTAVLLASGKIEQLRAEGGVVDGVTDGDCGEDFPNYQWKQTVSSTRIRGLHEVELTIESTSSGKQICELHTMLFEPYIPTETERKNDDKKEKARGRKRASEQ